MDRIGRLHVNKVNTKLIFWNLLFCRIEAKTMKLYYKIYLLITLISWIPLNCHGQDYIPIVNGDHNIEYEICHPIFDAIALEVYSISGDTVIEGRNYSIVSYENIEGYIRQDSTNSKLWYKEKGGDEKLIMDLNLGVGDSIFIDCARYGRRYSTVMKVETEDSRKVLELDYIYPETYIGPGDTSIYRPLKFIEGIGPSGFFLYQIEDLDFHMYGFILKEVRHDSVVVYSELNECYDLVPNATQEQHKNEWSISPNPCQDYIQINSDDFIKDLVIYNMFGQPIFRQTLVQDGSIIDVSRFPRGMYLVSNNANSNGTIKVFVKE